MTATPARAQRLADPAPGAASRVPAAQMEISPTAVLAPARDLPPALRPALADVRDAAVERRLSVAGHTAIGAGAGAATGALAFLAMYALDDECHSPDSMCGLAIPVMVGGGALSGGAVGLVVGMIRNR